ncbi:hypothetical protein SMKI_08G1450 [Saccharomyces mikatae IFO 1815]|uniref:non-specific serine/threonine protein kinase n=1 Tax=Saccharomyces mikatae IFO 1815 TaxID=226126 RepID=A0AA35IYX7_SACMI|nr:uncharacterized protein SMKI_08G1450 [Saccharomyces mikatae IFO 1815]CAI4039478.1 hypothetical protein SMKI_08G1450 [Saccharomyces mikatae IFO 1815]
MTAKPQNSKQSIAEGEMDVSSLFKRTEVIGRGKFGVVYKGYNVKTRRVYAIKVLNLDSDSDEVEDVQREIQFLASLKQISNITRYYGSYLKDTSLWIIMEYCAGGSLRSLLRPGKIDEKYIGVIMRELLVALKCIHKDNVIHRDIKAANVLITNEGNVKLCDFGVAAQVNQTSLRRQTMAGTPYWMAPEVIMEGVYYDTKVDIWSLGITTYEIATGNPPYCDVEALRAMQLIIKSKPPRLEGRSYSPSLKEFIALCLDEDPKERLSADDLLRSKFIKAHRATPTSILKELVSRYLLFRDKNKNKYRIEGSIPENEPSKPSETQNTLQTGEGDNAHKSIASNDNELKTVSEEDVEMKWDFDSLSSSDYIIENNINLDALAEDTNNEWATVQHDQFNYAYPDEDSYYFDPTNHNTRPLVYQGTTIGKGYHGTIAQNSTLNAPITNNYTNSKYPSKMVAGTTNTSGTHTTGPMTSSKKLDNKAPKQLLELFEDNEIISGENDVNTEPPKINKSISSLNAANSSREDFIPSVSNEANGNVNNSKIRPHLPPLSNGNNYYSQSTPALPLLQTKFNKASKGPPTSGLTTAPTSIEIEIPEELPNSALLTPASADPVLVPSTKARSSTVTATTPSSSTSVQYKPSSNAPRRLTVSSNRPEHCPGNSANQKVSPMASTTGINLTSSNNNNNHSSNTDDENSRGSSGSNTANSIQIGLTNAANTTKLSTHKASSPSRPLFGVGASPSRKLASSPTQNICHNSIHTNLAPPPTMKPMTSNKDTKDILLQPLNSIPSSSTINTIGGNNGSSAATLNYFSNEKESSRVNGDFKRNNPNLKLQMPLPTPVVRNKLLDPNAAAPPNNNGMPGSAGISTNENINQFGFNTSSASNIPVSMTPISEKHIDFGSKIKRSQSISNRKNSSASEHPLNILGSSVSSNASGISNNGGSNNSIPLAVSSGVTTVNTNTTTTAANSASAATTAPISQQSIPPGTHFNHILGSATVAANSTNSLGLAMYPPPQSLQMEMFLDLESCLPGKQRRVDRKPQVLKELENLLQMFEEGLPCIEHALKEQLISTPIKDNEH